MKTKSAIIAALILLPLVINLCVLPFMPAEIVIDHDGSSAVSYGSKLNTLIVPALGAIFAAVLYFASRLIDGERENGKTTKITLYICAVSVAAVFNVATYTFLAVSMGGL